jgi:hypothetical protein
MTASLSPGPQSRTPLRPPLCGYPGLGVGRPDTANPGGKAATPSPTAAPLAAEAESLAVIVDGDPATRDA